MLFRSEDDDIIFVGLIEDVNKEEILIATHDGYCTRFLTDTIRATGRSIPLRKISKELKYVF